VNWAISLCYKKISPCLSESRTTAEHSQAILFRWRGKHKSVSGAFS
jgi:hypothetical protein